MKISCFYVMTEPEKMGFPYMESIISSLSICDEIVIVLGRDEEASERKINNLKAFLKKDQEVFLGDPRVGSFFYGREIKVIKTNTWPEKNWNYDAMRDHIQIGLESCTGDLCMKIDADHVFRSQYSEEIKDVIIGYASLSHMTPINLVDFYRYHLGGFKSIPTKQSKSCYIINKKNLKEDNLTCRISNESGSNQPEFFDKNGDRIENPGMSGSGVVVNYIGNVAWEEYVCKKHNLGTEEHDARTDLFVKKICPINYSHTFCNKEMISKYWARWHTATYLKFNRQPSFDVDNPEESFKNFMRYFHKSKIPRIVSLEEEPLPELYRGHIIEKEGKNHWIFGGGLYTAPLQRTPDGREIKARGLTLDENTENERKVPLIKDSEYIFWFSIYSHPISMHQKIMTIDKTMWGYDNFKDDWEKIKNGEI